MANASHARLDMFPAPFAPRPIAAGQGVRRRQDRRLARGHEMLGHIFFDPDPDRNAQMAADDAHLRARERRFSRRTSAWLTLAALILAWLLVAGLVRLGWQALADACPAAPPSQSARLLKA